MRKSIVIITGASSGIGRATAIIFANSGFNVLAVGRNEIELFRTKSLSAKPDNITPIAADLSQASSVNAILSKLAAGDKVAHLVHCAADSEPMRPLLKASRDQVKKSMNANVLSPLMLTAELMLFFASETRVLFFGSDYVGTTNKIRENLTGTYGMAKSALDAMVEYVKRENKDFLVGYINPGATDTKMYQSIITAAGIFNNAIKPSDPNTVALFVFYVLTRADAALFKNEKWDFRNKAQHELLSSITNDENKKQSVTSKL